MKLTFFFPTRIRELVWVKVRSNCGSSFKSSLLEFDQNNDCSLAVMLTVRAYQFTQNSLEHSVTMHLFIPTSGPSQSGRILLHTLQASNQWKIITTLRPSAAQEWTALSVLLCSHLVVHKREQPQPRHQALIIIAIFFSFRNSDQHLHVNMKVTMHFQGLLTNLKKSPVWQNWRTKIPICLGIKLNGHRILHLPYKAQCYKAKHPL